MRYTDDHKQTTRQRIIAAAGRRFKQNGIDGSGIAAVMKDAGLTNGAFYAHFASKDDLVANVIADQLRTQIADLDALPPGRAGIEAYVRSYLSPKHRDHPQDGCPSAALLDEIGRCGDQAKAVYSDGTQAFVGEIAARLAPEDPQSKLEQVASAFALMIGTLQLSRATTDQALSAQILERGARNALDLMHAES
ncbi:MULTISPECIES: TetR/AcrR family transcriptional regulator [Glycomyces]|uniref:AcrR family transcriptional regulator n=2 Tax=Glycomyces TaxID=58113 RepID=A0A9X3PL76_9ACTN|nr:TetR/AcrR family transcriptional regulator [Glycomyces lechevalierae]MDA1387546.1 TetR/AcrR family transcriptional regulator [Glycomyces lechevalierae]MDR7336688.1 AcrR family transcriptional regulator [Glycomyces lechevalierae]